ncbi:MAG TPA: carbohydrate-binding protein, partial [Ktedonosporobacter sp.]|nr:carbohydrate-binding protein [Ktedonosporobacter sp.]
QGEILTEAQAQQFETFANQAGMGSVSFWEVSRDNGSCAGSTTASDTCSGLAQGNFDFINIFKAFNGSGGGGGPTPTPTTPTATPVPTSTPTPIPGVQPWNGNGHHYNVGDQVSFQGNVYKCLQAHTSQPDWSPTAAPSLWQLVGSGGGGPTPTPAPTMTPTPPTPTPVPGVLPWDSNGHHYNVGDQVSFQGHVYRCLQAHTSQPDWSPTAAASLWQLVS